MTTLHGSKCSSAWPTRVTQALVLVAMLSGFVNLIPSPVFVATVLIDAISLSMLASALIMVVKFGGRIEAWMVTATILVFTGLALTSHGDEGIAQKIGAIRNAVLYISPAIFIAFSMRDRSDIASIMRTVMGTGVFVAIFGVLQFGFRATLPPWLLYSRDTELYGYWGTDITRSTGLVGNSIVYGTLMTLVFTLWAAASLRPGLSRNRRLWTVVAAVVAGIAVLTSFSRVAIFLCVISALVIVVHALWSRGAVRAIPVAIALTMFSAILAVWFRANLDFQKAVGESFIIEGLFGGANPSVAGSTAVHDEFTRLALESFERNPWVGVGLGSQRQDSSNAGRAPVITDGFHLSTLVEGGLFLMLPTVALLVLVALRALAARRHVAPSERWLIVATFVFVTGQISVAGLYNTGFYGKVPNVVFWVTFGAVVALSRLSDIAEQPGLRRDVIFRLSSVYSSSRSNLLRAEIDR